MDHKKSYVVYLWFGGDGIDFYRCYYRYNPQPDPFGFIDNCYNWGHYYKYKNITKASKKRIADLLSSGNYDFHINDAGLSVYPRYE